MMITHDITIATYMSVDLLYDVVVCWVLGIDSKDVSSSVVQQPPSACRGKSQNIRWAN